MPRIDEPPNEIDRRIGKRLRQRRKDYGASLETVGAAIGLSGRQISNYETAKSRIPAATLYALAHQWDVPVAWFFDSTDKKSDYNQYLTAY